MTYRTSWPTKGWAKISWAVEDQMPKAAYDALLECSYIPGVTVRPLAVEFPENAWYLDPVVRFTALVGLGEVGPEPPRMTRGCLPSSLPAGLYEHQKETIELAVRLGHLLLGSAPGLGKTRAAIIAAETYAAGSNRARVVIGPKFTRAVWLKELLAVGAIKDESEFCALETRNLDSSCWRYDAKWYFVHYDVVSTWATRFPMLGARKPIAAICDEAHAIRTPQAQRTKGTHIIVGSAPFRMALTGTPMVNRPGELWSLLTLVGGKGSWGTHYSFRCRYAAAMSNGYGLQDMGLSNVEELHRRLELGYLRHTIESAGISLPSFTRDVIEVDLDEKYKKQHDALLAGYSAADLKAIVAALVAGRVGGNALKFISAARKITSRAKIETTSEYATSLLEQGESVVVFAWEREVVEKLYATISTLNHFEAKQAVYIAHGGYGQDDRDQVIRDFQKTGGALVATIDSLKEGVTLTAARFVVIHDLDWVPATVIQAERRCHRIGQTKPVLASWVIARDSMDKMLAQALLHKAEVLDEALGISDMKEAAAETNLAQATGIRPFEAECEDMIAAWRSGV